MTVNPPTPPQKPDRGQLWETNLKVKVYIVDKQGPFFIVIDENRKTVSLHKDDFEWYLYLGTPDKVPDWLKW